MDDGVQQCEKVLEGHTDIVWCVTVWKDKLISGSRDTTIRIWNEEGKCEKVLEGHKNTVRGFTVWKNKLISGSGDKTIRIWNEEGKCEKVLKVHKAWIWCVTM